MPSPPRPVVRVRVPAKINLHLGVGERRPDGFHDLTTVFHAVDLIDEVVAASSTGLHLSVSGADLPTDERNLAYRAAALLARRTGHAPDVRLRIIKRIPVAGGMAGGSADAAATLIALRRSWGLDVDDDTLVELASELGSDVAFGLRGGTAVGTGRGEHLTPVDCATPLHWVVVPASYGISAGAAYAELDRLRADGGTPPPLGTPDVLLSALAAGDLAVVTARLGNDLQAAALSLHPELRDTLADGLTAGALTGLVSGSGPTCVFLCESHDASRTIAAQLAGKYPGTVTATGPVTTSVCV